MKKSTFPWIKGRKGPPIGSARIGLQTRPIYSCREIGRGKNKGKLEVFYLNGTTTYDDGTYSWRYAKAVLNPKHVFLDNNKEREAA